MSYTILKNAVHNYLKQHIPSYTETTNNWVEITETTNAADEPLVYFGHPKFGVVEANATHNTFETPLELVEQAHTNATGPSLQRNADSVRISEALQQLQKSVQGSALNDAVEQIKNSPLYQNNKANFWQGVQFSFAAEQEWNAKRKYFHMETNAQPSDFLLLSPKSAVHMNLDTHKFFFLIDNETLPYMLASQLCQNDLTWNWKSCSIGANTNTQQVYAPLPKTANPWNAFLTFLDSTEHNHYAVFNAVINDPQWLPVWNGLAEEYFKQVVQNIDDMDEMDCDEDILYLPNHGYNSHFLTPILKHIVSNYFSLDDDGDELLSFEPLNHQDPIDEFFDFIKNTYPQLSPTQPATGLPQQVLAAVGQAVAGGAAALQPHFNQPTGGQAASSEVKEFLEAISQNKYGKILTFIQSNDTNIVDGLKTGVFINHALTVQNPDAFTELLKATPQLHNSTVTMLRHSVSRFEAYAKPAYEQTQDERLLIALLEWQMGISPNMVNKSQQQWIFDQWQQHPNKNAVLVTAAALSSTAWLVKPWKMELTQIAQTQPELLLGQIPQAMIAQRYPFVRETVRFLKIPPSAVDCGGISLLTKAQMLADNRQKDKQQSQPAFGQGFDLDSFFAHFSHNQKINNIEPTTSFFQAVKLMETQFKIAAKKPSM